MKVLACHQEELITFIVNGNQNYRLSSVYHITCMVVGSLEYFCCHFEIHWPFDFEGQ